MIAYEPKNWWRVFWAFQGTVIPVVGGRVLGLAAFTVGLMLFDAYIYKIPPLKPLGHSIMGVVVGLLLVFRTNSSYDRYWEGRKLWGALVNASRNLVRGAAAHSGEATALANLVSAYVRGVKQNLRGIKDLSEIADLVPLDVLKPAQDAANPPSVLALFISDWIAKRIGENRIPVEVGRLLESHLSSMVDAQGGCERILRTPIPFIYAVQIRHLLLGYLATLPFVLLSEVGWWSPLVVAAVAFGLLGIEEAGLEIEDPFGDDPNDLPLDDICAVIQRDATLLAGLKK